MNLLKTVLILLFVILTVVTVKFHPQIHNPLIIEDESFQIVEIAQSPQVETVVTQQVQNTNQNTNYDYNKPVQVQNIQVQNVQPQKTKVDVKVQSIEGDKSKSQLIEKVLRNTQKYETQIQEPVKKEVKVQPQTQPQTQAQAKPQTEKTETKVIKIEQPKQTSSNPYMTEEEEIIAWNVWRSNLHNQIMKDSNIGYSPYGTTFKFSFIVDKFGNISNIKVDVNPSQYMDIARNGVKPAISNLQNKPILNFPKGTKRTSTVVNGSFAVGTVNRYSTPKEYSDYERVVH